MAYNVSIVTISHNEEKNIEDCLSSLIRLNYLHGKYEIIVVDSSTDRTRDIVRKFPSVKLIESEFKEFAIKRNIGISEARYDLIAFIDADCIVPSAWLSKIIRKLNDEKVAAVAGNAFPPPNSPFFGKHLACLGKPAGGAIGFDSYARKLERGINVVATTSTIFKKSVLKAIGGFDDKENFAAGGEDWNVSHKIRDAGYLLEFDPDVTVYHKARGLRAFLKWSFRNGKAQNLLYDSQRSLFWLILNPFSVIWPILVLLIVIKVPLSIFAFMAAWAWIILMLWILVRRKNIKPAPIRKLRLLIERRKRIGVSMLSIFLVVVPLYYLDKTIINMGHLLSLLSRGFKDSHANFRFPIRRASNIFGKHKHTKIRQISAESRRTMGRKDW